MQQLDDLLRDLTRERSAPVRHGSLSRARTRTAISRHARGRCQAGRDWAAGGSCGVSGDDVGVVVEEALDLVFGDEVVAVELDLVPVPSPL